MYVLADALERAKSTDPKAIRNALAKTKLDKGPAMIVGYSAIEFDETGQNTHAALVMVQVNDTGKGMERITVWPRFHGGRTTNRCSLLRRWLRNTGNLCAAQSRLWQDCRCAYLKYASRHETQRTVALPLVMKLSEAGLGFHVFMWSGSRPS
jgi:hypothetical protein